MFRELANIRVIYHFHLNYCRHCRALCNRTLSPSSFRQTISNLQNENLDDISMCVRMRFRMPTHRVTLTNCNASQIQALGFAIFLHVVTVQGCQMTNGQSNFVVARPQQIALDFNCAFMKLLGFLRVKKVNENESRIF